MAVNPYMTQTPTTPKVTSGLSKKDGDMIARVIANHVHEVVAPLHERVKTLEEQLKHAQADAVGDLEDTATSFISTRGKG